MATKNNSKQQRERNEKEKFLKKRRNTARMLKYDFLYTQEDDPQDNKNFSASKDSSAQLPVPTADKQLQSA